MSGLYMNADLRQNYWRVSLALLILVAALFILINDPRILAAGTPFVANLNRRPPWQ